MCITSFVGGMRKQGVFLLGAVTCIHMSTNTHWSYQTLRNVNLNKSQTQIISSDTLTTSHGVISLYLLSSLDVEMMMIMNLLDADTVH